MGTSMPKCLFTYGLIAVLLLTNAIAMPRNKTPVRHSVKGEDNAENISLYPEYLNLEKSRHEAQKEEGNRCNNDYPVSAITHPGDMSAYTNTDKKPLEVNEVPYLFEQNAHQIAKFNIEKHEAGKWMMFFDKQRELDNKWDEAKRLYNAGRLEGINSMKVSTAFDNPRGSDKKKGVIIFYCGPYWDKAKMMRIGHELLAQMPYNFLLSYKADWQTLEGTRATGKLKNHLYVINPTEEQPKSL